MFPTTTRHTTTVATTRRKLPGASYPVASYPVANPRNAAFQLNQTTSRCFLDWFLNYPAGHPVATQFPPATGSSILRLVILSRAQRLPDATPAQRLIFPHYHQLQATVTIKFQILPVVGYSTVDSIFGGIRQL
ncbi:putative leucine-rich repeat receptor-like serine/threonine-protein kinase [Dorcoceras hygrometricum]|uniref:Putative leucine-rich repeat receptor-like serine/threonine-protein kinase n=1 Tax=Dorcoceras hygrometricum TaxID=472368 RepID=A0A2Z7A6Z3_9LAMI|nr:putative leucine-rich repeat receptor-like serine/threonine-protein kinase [Dorcoceras hygrometricum]